MPSIPASLLPNERVSGSTALMYTLGWAAIVVFFWATADMRLMPSAIETAAAIGPQIKLGAGQQMITSLMLSLESIFFATVIGLTLCYAATIPALRPIAVFVGSLRFLGLAGISALFIIYVPGGHLLKVAILTFAMTTFLVNSMMTVIDNIPASAFDHARTIGLSRFQILREVVIRGTLADAFDVVRMNAAIAWMMLSAVETLSRSEGGIGILLTNLNRMQRYDSMFAIQFMILLIGLSQDYLIRGIKALICPYSNKA